MRLRQRSQKSYAVPGEDFDEEGRPVPTTSKRRRSLSSDEGSVHEAEEEEEEEEEDEEDEEEDEVSEASGDDLRGDAVPMVKAETTRGGNKRMSPIRRSYCRPAPPKEPEDPRSHPAYVTAFRKVRDALARLAVRDTFELRSANCPDKVVAMPTPRKKTGTPKKIKNAGEALEETGTPTTGRGRGRPRGRGRGAAAERRGRGRGSGRGTGKGSADQHILPDVDAGGETVEASAETANEEGTAATSAADELTAATSEADAVMMDPLPDQAPLGENGSSTDTAKISATGAPVLPDLIQLKMGEKGFSCPVGTCDKKVAYRQGIRVHIQNNAHPLLEFLIWAYPDERAYDADETSQIAAEQQPAESTSIAPYTYGSLQQLVSDIPSEALPIKVTDFALLFEGFPRPSVIPIAFDAPETVAATTTQTVLLNDFVHGEAADLGDDQDNDGDTKQGKRRRRPTGDHRVSDATAPPDWGEQVTGPRRDAMRNEGIPALVGDPPYLFVRPFVEDFAIVSREEADPYLPTAKDPVSVVLSRPKAKNADLDGAVQLSQFEAHALPNAKQKGFVINAGCSIWGLDWCPTSVNTEKNFLAIGGYSGTHDEHHAVGESGQAGAKGCIQIWGVGDAVKDAGSKTTEGSVPKLALCLLHEFGCIWEMKWCPYGARDSELEAPVGMLPKIGLLAICFGDGTLKIIAVPCPDALRRSSGATIHEGDPLYVHILRPMQTLSIPDTAIWTVSWGGHTKIAAGCANGKIVVWDVESALRSMHLPSDEENRNPPAHFVSHYFPAHDACVRSVDWCSHDDPMLLSSVGMDGRFIIIDIRDPFMPIQLQRIRGFIFSTCWPKHYPGLCFTDAENGVRNLLVSQLGRTHGLMVLRGLIWTISSSNFHPFVATASADGRIAIANIHRHRRRSKKPVQQVLYQLCWNADRMTYSYLDEFKPEEVAVVYHTPENLFNMFFPEQVQMQRTAWSADLSSASWVAAGGSAGLVRLDATCDK